MRDDVVATSAADPQQCFLRYEDQKCAYLDTREQCQGEGITFIPMILESVGGTWGPQGAMVIAELAKASASASGESADHCAIIALQRLSVTLHRENARAVLRRR